MDQEQKRNTPAPEVIVPSPAASAAEEKKPNQKATATKPPTTGGEIVEEPEKPSSTHADSDWPFSATIDVDSKPDGLWTVAQEFLPGPARIRFEASGKWSYASGSECGPNGDMLSMVSSDQTILKGAPVGALIAKIGGSSAGLTDGTLYLIGSFAVVETGPNVKGPLYLTINDDPTGFRNNSGKIAVNIQWKPIPATTPPAAK